MSDHNSTFQLTIDDMDLIEEALRALGRELSLQKLAAGDGTSDEAKGQIEESLRRGEELLGRLHDQKIFYRPKTEVYVGG